MALLFVAPPLDKHEHRYVRKHLHIIRYVVTCYSPGSQGEIASRQEDDNKDNKPEQKQ